MMRPQTDRPLGLKMGVQPLPGERARAVHWPRLAEAAGILLILAASAWIFHGAFRCFFVQDDFAWLVVSRFHSLAEFARCFVRFNPAGNYRPLSQEIYFWLGQRIFGLWPPGFHIFGLAAHLAGVLLLYKLLRRFFSPLPALAGAYFYAVHGAHLISLYWISAFPEPLAMVFLLSAVLMFLRFVHTNARSAYALSLVAMLLGIMSKESILTLPLILAAYCFLFARSRLLWVLPFFALSVAALLARLIAGMTMAPYDVGLGRQTAESLLAYLSWMTGLSAGLVQAHISSDLAAGYRLIASAFAALILILFMVSRNRSVAVFSLLWIAFALQPVLYFSSHSYPYYLAPALAGFSLLIASALPPLREFTDWKSWAPALLAAGVVAWLSVATIDRDGKWWIQRAAGRQELINTLLAINRQVPEGGTAYILGLRQDEFDKLENGAVFKAYNLPVLKFNFLLPDLDDELDSRLQRLAQTGAWSNAYCFRLAGEKVIDQTVAFRRDPIRLLPREPVRFREMPGVTVEVSPPIVRRGKDVLTLRFANLNARAVDILYSIDGQLMPPVLHWVLNAQNTASVFTDITTPEGEYQLRAVRPSDAEESAWIRIEGHVTVR